MRYQQLIFEYVRDKTLQNYGDALMARIKRDSSASWYTNFIGQYKSHKHEGTLAEWVQKKSCGLFLMYCEEADPTPTHSYVRWMVQRYISGGIQRAEDIRSTCAEYLEQYEDIKRSGYFQRTTDPVLKPMGDINKVKSLFDLRAILNSISPAERISNTAGEKKKEQDLIESGAATVVVDTENCKVVIPHTEEAAVYFGRNTQWCTSARRNNMFASYNKDGPLFIVLKKSTNQRWQFHLQSGQFMDENDEEITNWSSIPKEALDKSLYQAEFNKGNIDETYLYSMAWDPPYPYPFNELAEEQLKYIDDEREMADRLQDRHLEN